METELGTVHERCFVIPSKMRIFGEKLGLVKERKVIKFGMVTESVYVLTTEIVHI